MFGASRRVFRRHEANFIREFIVCVAGTTQVQTPIQICSSNNLQATNAHCNQSQRVQARLFASARDAQSNQHVETFRQDPFDIHAIKNINSAALDQSGHTDDDGISNEPSVFDQHSMAVQCHLGLINWKRLPKTKRIVTTRLLI